MSSFHYVYILESTRGEHFYTGLTEDLGTRLEKHNAGGVSHTAKHRPWVIKSAVAFRSQEWAAAFESYPKTSSGRAFAKKRL
jgi:predicted GIY-YIG superfamily endonuclease